MEYKAQTSKDIRYYLAQGSFDCSQFTILEEKKIHIGNIGVHVGILGESHFIIFTNGADNLTEVCACTDATSYGSAHVLKATTIAEIKETLVVPFGTHTYSFSHKSVPWGEGEILLEELRTKAIATGVHTLTHIFPSHEVDIGDAVTEVYAILGSDITIKTVHTYPNEHVMVFTSTFLFLKKMP